MNLDEAMQATARSGGRKFRVAEILESLRADGRDDEVDRLEEMLSDDTISDYRLARVLSMMGHEVSPWPVKNYRFRYHNGEAP